MYRKKIAVLSGAGISAESGLSTYRDNGGMWDNYDPMEVASADAWRNNPGVVLDFYNSLRGRISAVKPNDAHHLLASLEDRYTVNIVTQNVDNLHERAGSTSVLHIHGEATKIRPENTCNELDGFSEQYVVDCGYEKIVLGDLAPNGAQYRPHIVFFGEAVPKIERAIDIFSAADIVIIIGTALQVYPAAGLYRYTSADTPIYLIDPAEVNIHDPRIIHIKERATTGMVTFCEMLEKRI